MAERVQRTTRRDRREAVPLETIEELFGDVISDGHAGLYGDAPPPPPRPAAREEGGEKTGEAPTGRSVIRVQPPEIPLSGGLAAGLPDSAYRDASEGAPTGFSRSGRFDFVKKGGELDAIVVTNGLATVLTLGLWRFWLKTRARKAVWSHTRLGGEPFEYTGSGWELLLGALIAVAFVGATAMALHLSFTWLGIEIGLSEALLTDPRSRALLATVAVAAPMLLEYARFRARRYRLRRTRWRAIRFDMTGSPVGLALRWLVFGALSVLTLGLAVPFLRVQRERYMTERTWWGKSRFRFEGSAWRLMPAWILAWAFLSAPAVTGAAVIWHDLESRGLVPAVGDAAQIDAARRAAAEKAAEKAIADAAAAQAAAAPETAPTDPLADAPVPVIAAPPPMLGGGMLEPGEKAVVPEGLTLPPPVHRLDPAPAAEDAAEETAAPGIVAAGDAGAAPNPQPGGAQAPAALRALALLRSELVIRVEDFAAADPATQGLAALLWLLGAGLMLVSYRAAEIRLFVEGRRLLDARARCTYGPKDILGAWLHLLGRTIIPGVPIAFAIGVVTLIPIWAIDQETLIQGANTASAEQMIDRMGDWRDQGLMLLGFALSYGMSAILFMWLTMAVLFRARHTGLCRSISVEGMQSLDRALQRGRAGPGGGEGFADALDVDAGF